MGWSGAYSIMATLFVTGVNVYLSGFDLRLPAMTEAGEKGTGMKTTGWMGFALSAVRA